MANKCKWEHYGNYLHHQMPCKLPNWLEFCCLLCSYPTRKLTYPHPKGRGYVIVPRRVTFLSPMSCSTQPDETISPEAIPSGGSAVATGPVPRLHSSHDVVQSPGVGSNPRNSMARPLKADHSKSKVVFQPPVFFQKTISIFGGVIVSRLIHFQRPNEVRLQSNSKH